MTPSSTTRSAGVGRDVRRLEVDGIVASERKRRILVLPRVATDLGRGPARGPRLCETRFSRWPAGRGERRREALFAPPYLLDSRSVPFVIILCARNVSRYTFPSFLLT
ncbi:unnamed protein product [Pieris brassicae]|uniref:Uncharacterized protein n=1 Tax=Pieris brassicae TaxID=7116 RepID=A0A9P0T9S6_PIEBR|nr:unnamed protein product [Pieris brassicae]